MHRRRPRRSQVVDVGRRDAARRRRARPDRGGDDAAMPSPSAPASTRSCTRSRRAAGNVAIRSPPPRHSARWPSCSHHLPRVAADGSDLARDRRCRRRRTSPGSRSTTAARVWPTRSVTRSGSLYHVPHGISVAVGLRRCAGVERRRASPTPTPTRRRRMGCDVDEIADVFAGSVRRRRSRAPRPGSVDVGMSVDEIADDDERCREPADAASTTLAPVSDDDREMLAARTVEVWHGLRS